jgi:ABC-type glycerol-3-phosphate transport system permease component
VRVAASGIESGTERRRATIHDVARSAGVSRQTVSRALNDKAEIDGATKQRVVMAGTLVAVVPLLVVFLFGARHFVRNIAAGALKG